MDGKQALNILNEATGALQADRNTHLKIQEALQVINTIISSSTIDIESKNET